MDSHTSAITPAVRLDGYTYMKRCPREARQHPSGFAVHLNECPICCKSIFNEHTFRYMCIKFLSDSEVQLGRMARSEARAPKSNRYYVAPARKPFVVCPSRDFLREHPI